MLDSGLQSKIPTPHRGRERAVPSRAVLSPASSMHKLYKESRATANSDRQTACSMRAVQSTPWSGQKARVACWLGPTKQRSRQAAGYARNAQGSDSPLLRVALGPPGYRQSYPTPATDRPCKPRTLPDGAVPALPKIPGENFRNTPPVGIASENGARLFALNQQPLRPP